MSQRAYSAPLIVGGLGHSGPATVLQRVPLVRKPGEPGYDERWIQELIDRHPCLLPIETIEPALTPAVPVCMELPTPSGFVDNLLVTPDGGLVLVECKLWRNPESRREVIGQILDYAKALSRWSFSGLENAIRQARVEPNWRLYDAVAGHGQTDLDEAAFCDAVARNLRHGRILLMVVGDGIQEGTEQLAEYLQQHVALHFSLALVELSLWKLPVEPGILVQPRILLRTTTIERGVVTLDNGVALAEPPSKSMSKANTLTEELFYEKMATLDPTTPARLKDFLTSLEPLGVTYQMKKTMMLRWRSSSGRIFSLAYIHLNGDVQTQNIHFEDNEYFDIRRRYLEQISSRIPGSFIRKTSKIAAWYIATSKGPINIKEILNYADDWQFAINAYISELSNAIDTSE